MPDPMSDAEVAELRRLMAEHSAPPYMVNARAAGVDGPPYEVWHGQGIGGPVAEFADIAEAELFVAAVNALPRLLAERDRLMQERDEAKACPMIQCPFEARAETAERDRDLAQRAAAVCREDAETNATRAESAEVRCAELRTRAESAEADLARLREAVKAWADASSDARIKADAFMAERRANGNHPLREAMEWPSHAAMTAAWDVERKAAAALRALLGGAK